MRLKLFLFFILISAGLAAQTADQNVLKIGYIDSDPATMITKMAPFTDYLAKNFSNSEIKSAKTVIARDTSEMASLVKAGKVDVYIDTIAPVIEVKRTAGLDILFIRWKKGVGEYKTLFIAKKDGRLTNLKGLNGLKLGFEDASSTSGRWMPQNVLTSMGYKLVDNSITQNLGKNIGYIFTGGPNNTALWVIQGKIDLGAISSTDYPDLPEGLKSNLTIIGESQMLPRQLVNIRSNISPKVKEDFRKFISGLNARADSSDMLKSWEKTAKIDNVTPEILKAIKTFEDQMNLNK